MLKDLGCEIKKTNFYKRSSAWNYMNEIKKLHEDGKTLKFICETYKCDISVINAIIKA